MKQPRYLKLQGKQEEVNQTQALRTSCKGWAQLQTRRAYWQAPVADVHLEHLEKERKVSVPFNKLFRGAVANSKE